MTNRITNKTWIALIAIAIAQPQKLRSAELGDRVDQAIARGIEAILSKTVENDVIQYHDRNPQGPLLTVTGNVTRVLEGSLKFETTDGRKLTIPRRLIKAWSRAGYVKSELPEAAFGGPTALAALALLSAGADPTQGQMKRIIDALSYDEAREAGTYVRSLRASVWSLMLDRKLSAASRRRYARLLAQDVNWLLRAMGPNGAFDYGQGFAGGDNSNTQFANLGLWAGSIGNIEIANRQWQLLGDWWMKSQHPGGGWSYRQKGRPTPSMTVAGCNSLYILLDRYYARADRPYEYFKGVVPNKSLRKSMERVYRAIEDGNRFLELNPPDVRQTYGYELFGLERLGLASGRSHIGGVEWFKRYAGEVADRKWSGEVISDSFALIFLVHGAAPVLFQKLEHDQDANEWNYYHRDLYTLCRYMSSTFERLYRWQRIPPNATLENLEDAPFLLISGHAALTLSDTMRSRIREYVDRGGTVFLHADRRGKPFIQSATRIFESIFADLDLRFRELDPTHPLYSCHFGTDEQGWKRPIPLRALADGPRLRVILCPVDIAGAWHQDRRQHEELFQIMANIRVYCAPPHNELPRVLRREPAPLSPAPPRGSFSIKRWSFAGDWTAHRGVWSRRADSLRLRTGLTISADETSEILDAANLASVEVVHLAVRSQVTLHEHDIAALRAFAESGGMILIESADGQPDGNAAVRKLVDSLPIGEKGILKPEHALATGQFDGGRPLTELSPTPEGAALRREGAPPPIITRTINGRLAVAACPFDLSAGLDQSFIWRRVGYTPESTERIVDNILLYCADRRRSERRP
ncbi:MAG: DUF4159 domain-containing protein [Phycisphaerae bacterium]|nr:DUF4159 domain-containing protein [Phycisphaerae bacterium]